MGHNYLWTGYKTPAYPESDVNSEHLAKPSAPSGSIFYENQHREMGIVEDMEVTEDQQPAGGGFAGEVAPNRAARWNALVSVCSLLYEQMMGSEEVQPTAGCSLVNSGELPVAQNVTIAEEEHKDGGDDEDEDGFFYDGDDDDFHDDDDDNQLVIDETPERVPVSSEVAQFNATRASVITMARSAFPPGPNSSPASEPELEPQPSTSYANPRIRTGSGSGSSDTYNSTYSNNLYGVVPPTKYFRRPKYMSQVSFNPAVPFEVPVRYNKNMARKFPGTENRTPEQQAIRDRNTLAARQSRAKLRVMDEMLQQEAHNEETLNVYAKERLAASFTYANSLRDILGLVGLDFMFEFDQIKADYVPEPMRATHHVPRGGPRPFPYRDSEATESDESSRQLQSQSEEFSNSNGGSVGESVDDSDGNSDNDSGNEMNENVAADYPAL